MALRDGGGVTKGEIRDHAYRRGHIHGAFVALVGVLIGVLIGLVTTGQI